MSKGMLTVVERIAFLTSVCFALSMLSVYAYTQTSDDDTCLEFYWDAATGDVDHYNVYLSIDQGDYSLVGTTAAAPTEGTPYALPVTAQDDRKYQLKVEAEDAGGTTGPMSEPSDIVWCKLRSPGDANGLTVGDANADLRVSAWDWAIMCAAWETQRGVAPFDYRADFNYDDSVNTSDHDIIKLNWGNVYNGGSGAPAILPPIAPASKCRIRLISENDIRIGEEVWVDIVVEGARDMYAMDFEMSFDPSFVRVEGIEKGVFFPAAGDNPGQAGGLRRAGSSAASSSWIAGKTDQTRGMISSTLAAAPLGSTAGRSGDGVIARLKVTPLSGGVSSISLKNIHAYDSKLGVIAVTPINAVLNIETAKNLLAQNYPNPFNPETWIPYGLAEECENVVVIIYSATGEEIRRLELGHRSGGFYTSKPRAAYWDGKNKDGVSVASGVYFYQIKAGDFSAIRKMVVLR